MLHPPSPTLFPYTTLFRSRPTTGRVDRRTRGNTGASSRPGWYRRLARPPYRDRSEEHTSELQSRGHLVCRLLLEKKKNIYYLVPKPLQQQCHDEPRIPSPA